MSGLWPKRAEWAAQVLNSAAAGEALQMNAGYFFRLLEHMTAGAFEKHAIISCRCMCFSASLTFSCSLQLSISESARALVWSPVYGRTRATLLLVVKNAAIDPHKTFLPRQHNHVVAPASALGNAIVLRAQT